MHALRMALDLSGSVDTFWIVVLVYACERNYWLLSLIPFTRWIAVKVIHVFLLFFYSTYMVWFFNCIQTLWRMHWNSWKMNYVIYIFFQLSGNTFYYVNRAKFEMNSNFCCSADGFKVGCDWSRAVFRFASSSSFDYFVYNPSTDYFSRLKASNWPWNK